MSVLLSSDLLARKKYDLKLTQKILNFLEKSSVSSPPSPPSPWRHTCWAALRCRVAAMVSGCLSPSLREFVGFVLHLFSSWWLQPIWKMLVKWDHFPRWKLKNIWNDLKHLKRPIYFPKCNKNLPIKKSVQRISGTLTLPGVPPTLPWGLDWIRRPASTSWKICAAWQLGPSIKPPPNRRDTHRKAWGFNDFFVMFSTKNAEIKWITLTIVHKCIFFIYGGGWE